MLNNEVEIGKRVAWEECGIKHLGKIVAIGQVGITVKFDSVIPEMTHSGANEQFGLDNGMVSYEDAKDQTLLWFDFPVSFPVNGMCYTDDLEVIDA